MPLNYTYLTHFAQAESTQTGILEGLGIDWTLLVLQTIAFLVLVAVLAKFVYPIFVRIIDERQDKIEGSLKAAEAAKKDADKAEARIAAQLDKARSEARDIVGTAKNEATLMLQKADDKSKLNAERMVDSAKDEIAKEATKARKMLHNETLDLVALATEKVLDGVYSDSIDKKVIDNAVSEARR